jgi:hypothetical protein
MTAKTKTEKMVIATIKNIMKPRDFDVKIQPAGKNQPEIVIGTSKNGTFEMKSDPSTGISVTTDGKTVMFDGKSENYITAFNLKHECYEYREKHYHPNQDGNWIKNQKQPGIFARIFGIRTK